MPAGPLQKAILEDPFAASSSGSSSSLTGWFYDVRDHGALPGVDVASALLAAVAAADAAGGGAVLIPAAYPISSATISVVNPVAILGWTGSKLTQYDANNLSPVLKLISGNITIDGMEITGSVAAGHESDDGTACILLSYVGATLELQNIVIKNCYLHGKNTGIESYLGAVAGFKFTNLQILNNKIRTLYRGMIIGPYAQNAVVNKHILCDRNDVEVSAGAGVPGMYANIAFARAIQIINTDDLVICRNRALGGFSSIETYAGTGATSPRPRQHAVHVFNNKECDGHIGFTQVTGGSCNDNGVDLSLRDPSWAAYDHATIVAAWGYLCGIEAADITGCTVNNNDVLNQVGAGIQYGATESCTLDGNTIINSSNTATPWSNGHAIMLYNHVLGGSISGNTLKTGKMSGIGQDDSFSYDDIGRVAITGNTIDGFQRNGIHIHNTLGAGGVVVIANNTISNVNLAASTYSGIDFTGVFGGDSVRGVQVTGNLIDSGKYGIYQPYFENAEVRGVLFANNQSRNATTAAYLCYGRRKTNTLGIGGVIAVGLTATHLDTRNLADDIFLDPGGAATLAFIDNAAEGDTISMYVVRPDTLFAHSANLALAGSVNVTPTAGSIFVFRCLNSNNPVAQVWYEVSRSIA